MLTVHRSTLWYLGWMSFQMMGTEEVMLMFTYSGHVTIRYRPGQQRARSAEGCAHRGNRGCEVGVLS